MGLVAVLHRGHIARLIRAVVVLGKCLLRRRRNRHASGLNWRRALPCAHSPSVALGAGVLDSHAGCADRRFHRPAASKPAPLPLLDGGTVRAWPHHLLPCAGAVLTSGARDPVRSRTAT